MSHSYKRFSSQRRATTLVEVIAALVILGTILSSLMLAGGRFARQEAQAQSQLRAIRALDELVSSWMNGPVSAIPLAGRGMLPDTPHTWRTHVVPDASARALGAEVLRVEVFGKSRSEAIVTIDLLVRTKGAS